MQKPEGEELDLPSSTCQVAGNDDDADDDNRHNRVIMTEALELITSSSSSCAVPTSPNKNNNNNIDSSAIEAVTQSSLNCASACLQRHDTAAVVGLWSAVLKQTSRAAGVYNLPVLRAILKSSALSTQRVSLCLELLDEIQRHPPATLDLEEEVLREELKCCFEDKKEFSTAADSLAAITSLGTFRNKRPTDKALLYLRIADLYLRGRNSAQSDIYTNKALTTAVDSECPDAIQQAKLIQARCLQLKCKYLEAALLYYDIYKGQEEEPHASRSDWCNCASLCESVCICTLLAPASQHKLKFLDKLVQDSTLYRAANFDCLRSMQEFKFMPTQDLPRLTQHFRDCEGEVLQASETQLNRTIAEHNILAASIVFANVKISSLAKLLNVDDKQVEALTCRLRTEDIINATLDQSEASISFNEAIGADSDEAALAASWRRQTVSVCSEIEAVASQIGALYPNLPLEAAAAPIDARVL